MGVHLTDNNVVVRRPFLVLEESMSRRLGLGGAIVAFTLAICAIGALIQISNQERRVQSTIGLTLSGEVGLRALFRSDGLADLPELASKNTPESRVDATFMIVQMATPRESTVIKSNTADSLNRYAASPDNPLVTRLKAFASLKLLGDDRWEKGLQLLEDVKKESKVVLGADEVASYLAIMEPALLLDPHLPKSKVHEFDPLENEQAERLAASVLTLDYYFANEQEIGKYFVGLRPKLCRWASGESQHMLQTLIAANAIQGTAAAKCISQEVIERYSRCPQYSLIAYDQEASGQCSLVLTYYAWRAGLWR